MAGQPFAELRSRGERRFEPIQVLGLREDRVAILVVPELGVIAAGAASFRARSSPSIVLRIRASSSRRKRAARSSACSLSASERKVQGGRGLGVRVPLGVLRSVGIDELDIETAAPALTSRN